jgi:hypothetical protein
MAGEGGGGETGESGVLAKNTISGRSERGRRRQRTIGIIS